MHAILILSMLLTFTTAVHSQPGTPPVGDTYNLLAGEHTPVIFTGSGSASASGGYTSSWMQIGYSPDASVTDNSNIGRYNPEYFTVGIKLACSGGGDSALVSKAWFELAFDTTAAPFWTGDSSNKFIEAGNYSSLTYGTWRYEALADTSRRWLYPIRVIQSGYIRLQFETTTADAVSIEWTLTGEH